MNARSRLGWRQALDDPFRVRAVWEGFRQLLEVMPLSHTELAMQLGVSQPTVSRWAAGESSPTSSQQLLAATEAIEQRTAEVVVRLERHKAALDAVERIRDLNERASTIGLEQYRTRREAVLAELDEVLGDDLRRAIDSYASRE